MQTTVEQHEATRLANRVRRQMVEDAPDGWSVKGSPSKKEDPITGDREYALIEVSEDVEGIREGYAVRLPARTMTTDEADAMIAEAARVLDEALRGGWNREAQKRGDLEHGRAPVGYIVEIEPEGAPKTPTQTGEDLPAHVVKYQLLMRFAVRAYQGEDMESARQILDEACTRADAIEQYARDLHRWDDMIDWVRRRRWAEACQSAVDSS